MEKKIEERSRICTRFETNAIPVGDDFAVMIDSSVNLMDDGFVEAKGKHPAGLVPKKEGGGPVLAIYQNRDDKDPVWIVELGSDQKLLFKKSMAGRALLTLTDKGLEVPQIKIGDATFEWDNTNNELTYKYMHAGVTEKKMIISSTPG